MTKTRIIWFHHVERRFVNYVVSRAYQMEGRQTARGRKRPRTINRETIEKHLEIIELDRTL